MIDQESGEIQFPDWTESLAHATTREQFLRSSLAQGANLQVKNESYSSWQLKPTEWNDKWWTVVIYFKDEKLYQILLTASDHEADQGWGVGPKRWKRAGRIIIRQCWNSYSVLRGDFRGEVSKQITMEKVAAVA